MMPKLLKVRILWSPESFFIPVKSWFVLLVIGQGYILCIFIIPPPPGEQKCADGAKYNIYPVVFIIFLIVVIFRTYIHL